MDTFKDVSDLNEFQLRSILNSFGYQCSINNLRRYIFYHDELRNDIDISTLKFVKFEDCNDLLDIDLISSYYFRAFNRSLTKVYTFNVVDWEQVRTI